MATTQLELYNNALQLIGQRRITSLSVDEDTRHYLDAAYNSEATAYCLELSKPVFATKTVKLSTSAVSTEHDLDNVFDLPSDYITTVNVFSDSKLDQPISRYILEGDTIACEHNTIYLRYISDTPVTSFTNWTPSFSKLLSAFLAKEICPKLSPTHLEVITSLFLERLDSIKSEEVGRKPRSQSTDASTTLTSEWLAIYNDALLIMGLDEITSNTDDSNRRAKLDRALNAGIVSELLEDNAWTFGLTSYKSYYDPSLEPEWGYSRVHQKPDSMHRLNGLYTDETMTSPLRYYKDEGDNFFTDNQIIYVEFVSTDFITTPAAWPTFFARYVAAKMAKDASPSLRKEGADVENSLYELKTRKSSALSNDAMSSPPKMFSAGSWVQARGSYNDRNRP